MVQTDFIGYLLAIIGLAFSAIGFMIAEPALKAPDLIARMRPVGAG